ncbi:hypothetical protein PLICRDRAFT_390093 [Plicaturopsis crispa FD-325 SS-3]|nr:hypothetical protein PLICRDRAFT_390093 [Plicaturopsis crispa FD-325 SS-3]
MPKEPEEEQWDVEVFLAARKVSKRSWLYLVKWADWPDRFNLWLSTANVMPSCKRLRESFWSHGVDVPDPKKCPVGTEIAANPEWIELEKARYAEVYGKTSKLDPDRLKKDIERWEQSNGVPSANPVVEPRDTDSDDIPLSQLKRKRDDSTPALKIRIPAAAVRRFQSVTESQISSQPDGEPPRKVARTDKQQPSAGSPSSLFSKSPTPDVAGESQSPTSEPANDFVPPADSRPITRPPVIERLRKEPPDIFLRPKKGKPQAPVETHDAAIVPRLPPNALATKLRIAERIFEPDRLQASHDSSSAVPPPPPPVEAIFPTSPTSHDFQDNIPLYEEPAFSFNDWLQDTGTPSDGELDRDEVVEMCLREEHHEPMPEADGEDSQVPQSPVLDNFDSVSIDLGDFFDREHTLRPARPSCP